MMLGPVLTLFFLGVSLAWGVFLRAGVYPADWATTIPLIGATSALYWLFARRGQMAPPLKLWLRIVVWAVPSYLAFQVLPLPIGLLRALSPARAVLAQSLGPVMQVPQSAPLAVNAPASVMWLFNVLCYVATFFLVRELCWRFSKNVWIPAIPLLVVAGLEAIIGVVQIWSSWPNGEATGTYIDSEHFCGLLEMVLPLAVMYGVAMLRERRETYQPSAWPAVRACAAWSIAALMLAAIINSQSRVASVDVLCSLLLIAGLLFGLRQASQSWRVISLAALAVAALALFIVFPPDQLIEQLAELSATSQVPADTRLTLWKETWPLVGEFPLFGTGLGGFESAFLRYQGIANAVRVPMAHNDFLQYLIELGTAGFALLTAALVGVLIPLVRGVLQHEDDTRRLLLIGCAGSFVSIALHSLVDFNLYIPANTMVLAWLAGIVSINGLE